MRVLDSARWWVAALVAAAPIAACSSSSGGGGGTDASTDTATDAPAEAAHEAGPEAGPEAGGCSSLGNTAPVVAEQNVASAPPTPAGGTIADGTYFLTAAKVFTGAGGATGPTGVTYQMDSKWAGGAFEYVEAITGGTGAGGKYAGTYATSGTAITITFTCGSTGKSGFTLFDATATSFTIYTPPSGGTANGWVFTKQ